MALDRLTRDELVQIVDLSHRCLAAESLSDVEAVLTTVGSITSFERSALCSVRGDREPSLEHFLNHSFGANWSALYTRSGFDRVDPILRHGATQSGAFRWGDAFGNSTPSRAGAVFLDAANDFGLVQGVAFACGAHTSPVRTVLSVASRDERNFERAMAVLRGIGPHLHEAYARLRPQLRKEPERRCEIELSSREREILRWTQDGKTYWEIGQIVGISQRTVKYHFERIKAKLDVVTASHAVAKAMRLGFLE
jgi:DNA-binding CsgD family transcriptional regulator